MIEYFLVICMFVEIEGKAFESTGQPRVECAEPLERRGPYHSEQACIKANQALGTELGLNKRGDSYMAMCDPRYREISDAIEERQQRRDSEREYQRTGPLRKAAGPSGSDSDERGRHREETAQKG